MTAGDNMAHWFLPKDGGCWCKGKCPHAPKIRQAEQGPRKLAAAETVARRVLVDAPDCPEAHCALAHFLGVNNRAALGAGHLERAEAVTGMTPSLAYQIALNLRNQAKIPEAIAAALRAWDLAPDNIHTHVAVAVAYQADGQTEAAALAVSLAEQKFGALRPLRRIAALVDADAGDYARAIERLAGDDLMPVELFDRGRFKERQGDYAGAWSDWMEGKRIQREREGLVYQPERMEKQIAALHESVRPGRREHLRGCSMPMVRPWPIFITGFPRSGTTMTEAALSAHPAIVAGDELMFVPELVERLPLFLNARVPYPRALMAMSWPENEEVIPLLRDYYIGKAHQKIGLYKNHNQAWYFTDKMPSNELHWPLLSHLFPESPLIHCRRHPLDVLVSCMSHHLIGGSFNACHIEWCARYYGLVDDLTDAYRTKLKLPMLREVRYETFVRDHRNQIDALLPADLAPDARCHDFHLNPWHSRTLSYRQVKEPAHDKSVGRYKPFLEFLRPIVPLIQATLDREGYEL